MKKGITSPPTALEGPTKPLDALPVYFEGVLVGCVVAVPDDMGVCHLCGGVHSPMFALKTVHGMGRLVTCNDCAHHPTGMFMGVLDKAQAIIRVRDEELGRLVNKTMDFIIED